MDYERADGVPVRCLVFMEFSNLEPAELNRVDDAVANENWSDDRQRSLSGRPAEADSPEEQSEVLTNQLSSHLYEFAATVVPDLLYQRDEDGKPTFSGFGASCRTAEQ